MNKQTHFIHLPAGIWLSSPLSVARDYIGLYFNDVLYIVANKEADLVRADYIKIVPRPIGQPRFLSTQPVRELPATDDRYDTRADQRLRYRLSRLGFCLNLNMLPRITQRGDTTDVMTPALHHFNIDHPSTPTT